MSKKVFDQIAEGLQEAFRPAKFPPRAVKRPVSPKRVAEDTLKRYPRIMAELAK
jgi:hypothetical protein